MIVKMKKYAFMVYHKEYDAFLNKLRDLGVVHIQPTKSITDNADLQGMISDRKKVAVLLRDFKRLNSENKDVVLTPAREITKPEGEKLVEKVESLQEYKSQLLLEKQAIEKDLNYMELWGDFSYANINHLKQAGFDVTFYSCPTSKYEPKWGDEYNAILINNIQSVTYFLTITKEGTAIDIEADRPKMPTLGLSKLRARFEQLLKNIQETDEKIKETAAEEYNTLVAYDKNLEDDFNFTNAIVQMDKQAGDKLMFLEGWTTADQAESMEKALDEAGYFFYEEAVQEEDKAPIKLKNNSFSKLYEPIIKMYSLPNYAELDPTPLVAPFFMLFFGLCFGDGGYGLIILIACALLKKKMPDFKPFLSLFQWLGGMTIVVGTLTGTFFGMALVDIPAFSSVKDYFLSSDNLMTLSIVIGVIHIIFGKAVAAYKTQMQKGIKYSIAPWAWVFIISSLMLAFGLPMLDVHLPQIAIYICYGIAAVGALFALFYNSPGKNPFMNFGAGLWHTYNMASGLLGDTLSYIRLFAIGLTGGILGGVFNMLAIDMTATMPIVARIPVMLIILLIGHGLNFGLCTISSLVHPVRLIFVEYFKNSDF
ncbi:ATPase, partial [Parabacteroides sp. OttesenSCG-928-G21]|nr:ATPase [Parabacteroides sp. OttesenSCG-928-G21]